MRLIDAERVVRTGLASDLVPDEELDARAQRMIDMMLANSPVGVRLTTVIYVENRLEELKAKVKQ